MRTAWMALAALLVAGSARAEVAEVHDGGFRTRNTVELKATPEAVWKALGEVGRWWNGSHTYSGKALNLSMKTEAGACFCEALSPGSVRHGVVAMAMPNRMLRLEAALGPLQDEGVSGALTFQIKPKGQGVEVVQTFHVGGMRPGPARTFAPAVDGVVREQLVRLGRDLETGKPD